MIDKVKNRWKLSIYISWINQFSQKRKKCTNYSTPVAFFVLNVFYDKYDRYSKILFEKNWKVSFNHRNRMKQSSLLIMRFGVPWSSLERKHGNFLARLRSKKWKRKIHGCPPVRSSMPHRSCETGEHINYIPDSTRSEWTHLIMLSLITLVNVFIPTACV